MASSDNHGLYMQIAGRVAQRVPGLKMIPVVRLIMAGEVLLMGKQHLDRLTPEERHTLVHLVSKGKGRPSRLDGAERQELQRIVEKLEPRALLAEAADRISPLGVPSPVRNRIAGSKKRGSAPS